MENVFYADVVPSPPQNKMPYGHFLVRIRIVINMMPIHNNYYQASLPEFALGWH
jgi:hypothetical protein